MEKEKVIFRREYDKHSDRVSYLAIFPNDADNRSRYSINIYGFPFHFWQNFAGEEETTFECYTGISPEYYYNCTRIVHKNDSVIPKLVSAIEKYFGISVKVAEKFTY